MKAADTWDLSSLFTSDDGWEQAFARWEKQIPKYDEFRGTLGDGPAALAACLKFDSRFDRTAERLGTYASLKTCEDLADSRYQRMEGRFEHAASRAAEAASYIRPEILALPKAKLDEYLAAKALRPYRLVLERLVRYKPHTLSRSEEKLLAMQSEMADAARKVFGQLTDADMKFGTIRNEKGELVELSNATFTNFLHSPSRAVRRRAFHQYYEQFQGHENSLAAALAGSVQKDVYYAKARNYPSAREASLFRDNMPLAVYDNLVAAVHKKLPALYDYFQLRRKKMRLRDIHHYDTYVPILSEQRMRHTWDQATDSDSRVARAAGRRILPRAGRGPPRAVVRPLSEPGQAERWLQLRHVRRLAVHPDELPARRAVARVHAGPRGGPFDAQPLLSQASAV